MKAEFETSFKTMRRLSTVGADQRREIVGLPRDRAVHAERFRALPVFGEIEVADPPQSSAPPSPSARVAFWNAERCKDVDSSAALLANVGADVNLLCEMDLGMARSGQVHTTREVAARLRQGYAFAVEFVELGLGNASERVAHAGEANSVGHHGAAIVSRHRLEQPALIRLESDGDWFDGANGERRVGGRIALVATVPVGGVKATLVSVHFESHGGPTERAQQMRVLLAALDAYAPDAPVVVGGDFNTQAASRDQYRDAAVKRALVRADPARFVHPVDYEPLFDVATDAGYDWRGCNVIGAATNRARPGGAPAPLAKLDWFFTRGLGAADPEIVPAVDGDTAISDHELLAVTVFPE